MKVLALITARGGSKGLPGKNIRDFHGHPLIAWSIAHAQSAGLVSKVLLSTDDEKIGEQGRRYGAEVPFLRPEQLSNDNAGTVDVAIHALEYLETKGESFDILLLLQPTSPVRRSEDLDEMLKLLEKNWSIADGIVTIGPMKPSPLHSIIQDGKFVKLNDQFRELPRQSLPEFFASYGVAWAIKVSALKEQKTFHPKRLLPWKILREQAVDIDDLADFVCAEVLQSLAERNDPKFRPIFRNKI